MADIIKISDATALALHAMVHLASTPDAQTTTAEVAEAFDVSRHHLAKVFQRLTRAGFVVSSRGPKGGIGLARDPKEITLLEIYELIEGDMLCRPCLFGKEVCPRPTCALAALLPQLARQVRTYFEQTTLAQLAVESNWGAEVK